MKKKIAIINGVNLGNLGTREVDIYGFLDFETYFRALEKKFPEYDLSYFQFDTIDEIVKTLLSCNDFDGILLNPGAYTHTSVVLADTIRTIQAKVIEVHISNVFAREQFRRKSWIATVCAGSISGFGLMGYELALSSFKPEDLQ